MEHDKTRAWRGAGSRPWSSADDALLAEARCAGFGWGDCSALLDRSEGAVRLRHATLQERAKAAAEELRRAARVKRRACLQCRVTFLSEGPGNRLCTGCRAYAGMASPIALNADVAEAIPDVEPVPAARGDAVAARPTAADRSPAPRGAEAAAGRGQSGPRGRVKVGTDSGRASRASLKFVRRGCR